MPILENECHTAIVEAEVKTRLLAIRVLRRTFENTQQCSPEVFNLHLILSQPFEDDELQVQDVQIQLRERRTRKPNVLSKKSQMIEWAKNTEKLTRYQKGDLTNNLSKKNPNPISAEGWIAEID